MPRSTTARPRAADEPSDPAATALRARLKRLRRVRAELEEEGEPIPAALDDEVRRALAALQPPVPASAAEEWHAQLGPLVVALRAERDRARRLAAAYRAELDRAANLCVAARELIADCARVFAEGRGTATTSRELL